MPRQAMPSTTAACQPWPSITAPAGEAASGDADRDRGAEPRERLRHRPGDGDPADLAVERCDDRSDRQARAEEKQRHRADRARSEWQRHQAREAERADDDPPPLVARGSQARQETPDERSRREPGERDAGEGAVALSLREGGDGDLDAIRSRDRARRTAERSSARRRRRGPRAGSCACPPPGPAARTGGIRENAYVPSAASTAAPATAATGSTTARTATRSGPPTKITSCSAASRAYAVRAPSAPATVGQIERSTDETGASVSPAAAAATAIAAIGASSSPSTATSPKSAGKSTIRRRSTSRAPRRSTWRPP